VVEDFHYLKPDEQRIIFQQWKTFIDNEVSVIVIGTTHHAIDIATANQDLLGRLNQIDIAQWSTDDLERILIQGFTHLGAEINDREISRIFTEIAKESVGLSIITQQAAEQIFQDLGIDEVETKILTQQVTPQITLDTVYRALHNVANAKYNQLRNDYLQLTTGPRKRARKYNTYEFALTCFTLEPLQFSLMRHEIEERMRKLPVPAEQIPPSPSVGSMLNALTEFQKSREIELLEWRSVERTLYILEPAFLFYLRWRQPRELASLRSHAATKMISFTEQLLKELRISIVDITDDIINITKAGAVSQLREAGRGKKHADETGGR
jgi:hypothetical protein